MKNKVDNNEIIKNTNFIKIALMLLVVIGHSTAIYADYGWFQAPSEQSELLKIINVFVNSFHIYAFVLISGYIYSYLKYENGKYINFKKFMYNKFKKLIIPFIFVSIFWAAPWFYYYHEFFINEFVTKYILCVSPSQLWFLLMLFNVFILSYFTMNKLYDRLYLGIFISLLFYLLGFLLVRFIPNYFQISSALRYYLFFYLGVQLRHYKDKIEYRNTYCYFGIIFEILLFYLYYSENTLLLSGIILKICKAILGLVLSINGSILSVILLNKLANSINYVNKAIYKILNKYNFSIYLFHQQLIYIIVDKFNGVVNPFILSLSCFVISTIVALLLSHILSLNKYTKNIVLPA